MVSNWSRVISTIFVWLMGVTIIHTTRQPFGGGFETVMIVAMVIAGLILSTRWIWLSGTHVATTEKLAEKGKRGASDRVSRLVESLSDEELAQLRARLSEQERMVPLEDLLHQRR
mgnify:CR=1 FL=1